MSRPEASAAIELTRKHSGRVTIAQISDLHFTTDTKLSPKDMSPHLKALVDDIAKQAPDLLCVTGDIAENPWRTALRELTAEALGDDTSLTQWNDSLEETFKRAREFLSFACDECRIDPTKGLFVIPGNHDYRIQGVHSGWLFSRKRSAQAAKSTFESIFAGMFPDSIVTLVCHHGEDPIVLRIACLDSNSTDAYLNFATGAIEQPELDKLDCLGHALPGGLEKALQFRVCLVHHHPLPVVTAEALRDVTPSGFSEKIKSLGATLTGEQTNMFKNGGTFLLKCLDNHVDLVLHGHQHRSWFSNIQYPATSAQRLLVAGAGSAAKAVAESYRYCVYALDVSGNIHVTERMTAVNPIRYVPSQTQFSVYEYEQMRKIRQEKLVRQLDGVTVQGLGCKYGSAKADEISRVTRIDADGNALMRRTYRNLLPTGQEPIDRLPVQTLSRVGFLGVAPPKIAILEDRDRYYRTLAWKEIPLEGGSVGGVLGVIEFTPRLHPHHPLSIQVEYLMCNTFQFVRDYRRGISDPVEDLEHSVSRNRAVYPRVTTEVILFPQGFGPTQAPLVHVARRDTDEPDEAETAYCRNLLSVVYDPGIISLTVRDPLPDFNYRVSWHLRSEKDFNRICYTPEGVAAYERLKRRALPSPDLIAKLTEVLLGLKRDLANVNVIDDYTEVMLQLLVVDESGHGEQRVVRSVLHRFAAITAGDRALTQQPNAFAPGIGLAGQAFRGRHPLLFRKSGEGNSEFYIQFRKEDPVHSVLLSVPLPALGDDDPAYGVISLGAFADNSILTTLRAEEKFPFLFLIDVIQGKVNREIQNVLGRRPQDTSPSEDTSPSD